MGALDPASMPVVVSSPQPFIPGSQAVHHLEEEQGQVALNVVALVKTLGF